jgi:hypothetical protein
MILLTPILVPIDVVDACAVALNCGHAVTRTSGASPARD